MFGVLALLFLIVPIVELYVIVQVAQGLGLFPTLVLLVVVSAAGAWLCKREGLGLLHRVRSELEAGRVPTGSVVDGFLVLFGGALLLTPGFLTDVLGLALLIPPVRAVVRAIVVRRLAVRAKRAVITGRRGPRDRAGRGWVVYDVRSTSTDDPSPSPPPSRSSPSGPGDPPPLRP